VTITLSRTVHFDATADAPNPTGHFMVESGEGLASGEKLSSRTNAIAMDYFGMIFHGTTITHVDSLAHFFWEGETFNGNPAHLVSTSMGATVGSVEEARNGIVTREVLVDVPLVRGIDWVERGEGVMPEDILGAEARCGFKVEEGDVLLIRTGHCTAARWKVRWTVPWAPPRARRRVCPCFTSGASPRWSRTPATTSTLPNTPRLPARYIRLVSWPWGSGSWTTPTWKTWPRSASGATVGNSWFPSGAAAVAQHHRLSGQSHRHILTPRPFPFLQIVGAAPLGGATGTQAGSK